MSNFSSEGLRTGIASLAGSSPVEDYDRSTMVETYMLGYISRDVSMTHRYNLEERLKTFIDAGLIHKLPTWQQVQMGSWEMWPAVLSPTKTDKKKYEGTEIGKSVPRRTMLLLKELGYDHLRVGSGLGGYNSLHNALHINYVNHDGEVPHYDIQLAQTLENGLDYLYYATFLIQHSNESKWKKRREIASRLLPDPFGFRERMLDLREGYIVRADQDPVKFNDSAVEGMRDHRVEFATLVNFLNYCATTYPQKRKGLNKFFPFFKFWGLAYKGLSRHIKEINS